MDLLCQHEAFLRAIYLEPEEDTPRLVYADFLEDHGDPDRAAFIRLECELARHGVDDALAARIRDTLTELLDRYRSEAIDRPDGNRVVKLDPEVRAWPWANASTIRGFPCSASLIELRSGQLADEQASRLLVTRLYPEAFGARSLVVLPGPQLAVEDIDRLFALPFVQQVVELHLPGIVTTSPVPLEEPEGIEGLPRLIDMSVTPTVSTSAVIHLAGHRGARRITALDLRNNNLDNDAARALVKSPYLDNLKRLDLLEGNRFRGKVWQQVIARFGENVVG
jgi:uncharacterized protein (TIGR02996 family)